MSDENIAKARRAYEVGWNEGKLEVFDELYADGFRLHENTGPQAVNKEGYQQYVSRVRADWANFHLVVEDAFASGDKVVLRGSGTAICQDQRCGADAAGKPTKWSYISIFRFAEGKVAELWNNFDALTYLHEVGAVSLPWDSK